MKEARPASPPVVPVEAAPTLRFPPLLYFVIFFLTHRSFSKILACNISRYCICSPYCCYTCDLNILSTRIEASVSSFRNWGVTMQVRCSGAWSERPLFGPPHGWQREPLPCPELWWRQSPTSGSSPPRARARAAVTWVVGSW
jgi:hypothetical protein